jgi:hypothetical protein
VKKVKNIKIINPDEALWIPKDNEDAFAKDWYVMSAKLFANAFGDNEPDYENYPLREANP